MSQYLKTSSLDAENVEASTINLVDSYDLSCIDLMPFYDSPDEAGLIFHPAQTGPGTTDYDIQLYFTYGSSGGFADWLAGPSIQMMRFHPAIGFYNAVSYSNPVVFPGSATFSALLKAQQAEIDQLKINSPLYEEGFLAWQDAGGLSMTRPSITESLGHAEPGRQRPALFAGKIPYGGGIRRPRFLQSDNPVPDYGCRPRRGISGGPEIIRGRRLIYFTAIPLRL